MYRVNLLAEVRHIEETAELLYQQQEVEAAIEQMAEKINLLLSDRNPILLTVLNGGIVTAGKLLTQLNFPLVLDAIHVSRYQNKTQGGSIEWLLKPDTPMQNRTVLIVDDILDEGLTLEAIYQYCQAQGAASIYSAVLIDKQLDQAKPVQADFVGLQVENRYIFGYGLDYKGYLRNAPGIYICKE